MHDQERNKDIIVSECLEEVKNYFEKNNEKHLYKHIIAIVEKPLIELVLKQTYGNQKKAAKLLGINRNTLHSRIKKLGIDVSRFKQYYSF